MMDYKVNFNAARDKFVLKGNIWEVEEMTHEFTPYFAKTELKARMVGGCLIDRVIYNDPATVVIWADGVKTVVICHDGDTYDPEKGLLLCIAKRMFGNGGRFNDVLREHVPEYCCDPLRTGWSGEIFLNDRKFNPTIDSKTYEIRFVENKVDDAE